jgi:hypothetical protein
VGLVLRDWPHTARGRARTYPWGWVWVRPFFCPHGAPCGSGLGVGPTPVVHALDSGTRVGQGRAGSGGGIPNPSMALPTAVFQRSFYPHGRSGPTPVSKGHAAAEKALSAKSVPSAVLQRLCRPLGKQSLCPVFPSKGCAGSQPGPPGKAFAGLPAQAQQKAHALGGWKPLS